MSSLPSWLKRSKKSKTPQTTPTQAVQPQPTSSPTSPVQLQPTPATFSSPQPPSQNRSIVPDDPSKLDHSLGILSTALAILKGVSEITHVPGLKGAADIALTLVETLRNSRANISGSADLAYHAAYLIKGLCESCPESPNEGIRRVIDDFIEELKIIGDKMTELSLKSSLKGFVASKTDADNIKAYRDSLNMAYKKFTMALAVNTNQVVSSTHQVVSSTKHDTTAIIEITSNIERRLEISSEQDPSASLPSVAMPSKPKIFFGRDDYVKQVVDVIIDNKDARVAILGSGGMGKTSIALTVMQDPRITNTFDKHHRYWVPCEKATSPEFLVGLLAKSTKVSKTSNDQLKDVVEMLEISDHRHMFLLDNFETLMGIEGKRAESEAIISAIDLPNVTILVTMRGAQPPSTGFQWTSPSLPVLALAAAHQTFITICPGSESDNRLDELLQELDCVPLAVNLMASLGNLGESATELLGRWKEERTPLLHRAEDRLNSVDHSIRLSLASTPIRSNPEAIQLLAILSMLPGGAQKHLMKEVAPSIKNLNRSLDVLLRVSLAYKRSNNAVIHVLSPIRSYMIHHHQLDPPIRQDIYKTYYDMVKRGGCIGEPKFVDAVQELSKEEANLEAVLLDALEHGDRGEAITASLGYAWYLYGSTPRMGVISEAIAIAKQSEYHQLYAECILQRGNIHYRQNRYDKARSDLEAARREFEQIGSQRGVAQCLQSLGLIHRMQCRYDGARTYLEAAQREFEQIGERLGAAQCLQNLGEIHRMQSCYDEARTDFEAARREFEQVGSRLGAAQCLQRLGMIHQLQDHYDEAQTDLEAARREFVQIGSRLGAAQCLKSLGDGHQMQYRYSEARADLEAAQREFEQIEERLGAAQCLKSLGNIHQMQSHYDEARTDLEAARREFEQIGSRLGAAQCLKSLGEIHQMQSHYDEARTDLEVARREFEQIRERRGAAQCLQRLGEIHQMQYRYDEARTDLEAARREFEQIRERRGAAQCLQRLGEIHRAQSHYDEARSDLKAARRELKQIGERRGAARCRQTLGEIHRMQCRYHEARADLEAARRECEQIGERGGAAQCLKSLERLLLQQGGNAKPS